MPCAAVCRCVSPCLQLDDRTPTVDVMHKKYDDRTRHRDGYSEAMGVTLHRSVSVMEFLHSDEPVSNHTLTMRPARCGSLAVGKRLPCGR